jgi:hypothetical protein
MRTLPIAILLAALAAGCCPMATAPAAGRTNPAEAPRPIPGEYVFSVAPGTSPAAIQGTLADLAPRRIVDLGGNRLLVIFGEDPGLSRLSFRLGDGRLLDVQPHYAPPPAR